MTRHREAWNHRTLAVIGAGQMAEALIRAVLDDGLLDPRRIRAIDPSGPRRGVFQALGCAVGEDVAESVDCDTILLSIKPQQAETVLTRIGREWRGDTLVVSVMAGVPIDRIAFFARRELPIVRVMPNLPLVVGAGASAVSRGPHATAEHEALVLRLFSSGGQAWPVREAWLDAVTALSGSGPAYVFQLVEALSAAGAAAGLPVDTARELARATLWGAAKMLHETGLSAATLRERVTSPGGTTEAALSVLNDESDDAPRGMEALMRATVRAAVRRSGELAGR